MLIPWDRRNLHDAVALACAAMLALTPACTDISGAARWNAWLTAYAIATLAIASLTAEAPWTPRAQATLGGWIVVSTWLFDLWTHEAAAAVHVLAGLLICASAAAELRTGRDDPPSLHRPGAASRPIVLDRTMVDARRRTRVPVVSGAAGARRHACRASVGSRRVRTRRDDALRAACRGTRLAPSLARA